MKNTLKVIAVLIVLVVVTTMASAFYDTAGEQSRSRYYQHASLADPDESTYHQDEFNTKLPIVNITTFGQTIPGEMLTDELGSGIGFTTAADGSNYIRGHVEIFDTEGAYNHLSDRPALESAIDFRIRGNSSRHFDKRSYKLVFVNEDGTERNVPVMGMEKHDEWALYGPFLDKTLLRNYIGLNLAGELNPYTPDVRYCEVYLDGEYRGLYVMMELVTSGPGRVNLESHRARRDMTSYLVRLDKEWFEDNEIETFTYYSHVIEQGSTFSILYPGRLNLTDTFVKYIADDISKFEKALFSYDFKDPERGYRAYIDVQSFVDYYIMSEFMCLNDMTSRSTYMYKTLGGKLTMGPGWDYNNIWDNFLSLDFSGTEFLFYGRVWYDQLMKDEYFVDMVVETYRNMRNGGILDEEYLLGMIDDTIVFLGDAIDRNYQVWGYSFDATRLNSFQRLRPIDRNPRSYDEAVIQMKEFIKVRGRWMDRYIHVLYQYCHASATKQYIGKEEPR